MKKWIIPAGVVVGVAIFLCTDKGKSVSSHVRDSYDGWSSRLLHFTERLQDNLENLQSGLQTFQRTLRDTIAS